MGDAYNNNYSFFLGANSYIGFDSLYEDYVFSNACERLYILKGGAGCGKSTFLRIAADMLSAEGFDVNYIYCSGDPESLDGIEIPSVRTILIDGTAPHILEPRYAGERDFYIDLSVFYRNGTSGLKAITDSYREKYARAYSFLRAAGNLTDTLTIPEEAKQAISRRAGGVINRELKKTGRRDGKATRFYADAFTCMGMISFTDTLTRQYKRLISLDNACGASDILLRPVAEASIARGYDIILCPSPFSSKDIWHLAIPELSLCFISARGGRRLHLDKMVYDCMAASDRQSFKETLALREQILAKALSELKAAKALHDRLEARVNPDVDFDGVRALAKTFAQNVLLPKARANALQA